MPAPAKEKRVPRIDQLTWRGEDGRIVHGVGSNFFIEPDGTCVESEFQAEKLRYFGVSAFTCLLVRRMKPGDAKKAGGPRGLYPMSKREQKIWQGKARAVMKKLVRRKFFDHDNLADWLLSTGNATITEGNWWHDQIWGSCTCQEHFFRRGKNWLGKILMEVRDELRDRQTLQAA